MRIQSILVVALVESDFFDDQGLYLGTDRVEYRAKDLDDAARLLRKMRRLMKKGATENAIQPEVPGKPASSTGPTVDT